MACLINDHSELLHRVKCMEDVANNHAGKACTVKKEAVALATAYLVNVTEEINKLIIDALTVELTDLNVSELTHSGIFASVLNKISKTNKYGLHISTLYLNDNLPFCSINASDFINESILSSVSHADMRFHIQLNRNNNYAVDIDKSINEYKIHVRNREFLKRILTKLKHHKTLEESGIENVYIINDNDLEALCRCIASYE